jgi:thiol-disulfide isomerase/thioredoxin
LRGKVVLIDFWTYTCINCIRTLPHVTSWYDKYKDQGFTVIGIHTPEFEFEKNTANVADAIQRFNIHYPVPQDNDYGTWNAYSNQYWPAEYLIDSRGQIRRVHFGEGKYEEMEQAIQLLLKEAGKNVTSSTDEMPDETPQSRISPETYLGESRSEHFYLTGKVPGGEREYKSESLIPLNSYSLGGTWSIEGENALAVKNSELIYHFTAQKVFLVMGADRSAEVMVYLDGKPVAVGAAGADVNDGKVSVKEFRLYSLIQLKQQGDHILRLVFPPGVEAFAFTFG